MLVHDVVKDIPFGVSVANRAWVLSHKDVVRRFLDGLPRRRRMVLRPEEPRRGDPDRRCATPRRKKPICAKTYDFFHRIGFFNRSDAVSKKHLQNIMDVLIGFHDIEKRIDIDRLIVPEVTRIVD